MENQQGTSVATEVAMEDNSQSDYRSIDSKRDKIRTLSDARTISAEAGSDLRRLTIFGDSEQPFTLGMLAAFLVNCPNIEHFEFDSIFVQELGMLKLLDDFVAQGDVKINNIKSVSFDGCNLDDSQDAMFFRHLERASNLESVSVKFNGKLTGKWLKYFKDLKSIDLECCSSLEPSYFIEFCKSNKTLVNLHLSMTSGDPDFPDFAMNQKCIKTIFTNQDQECVNTIFKELKNLQSISICCTDFPDSADLSILGSLEKLEELEIRNLNRLAIPLLSPLAWCQRLRALKCHGISAATSEEEAEEIFRLITKMGKLKSLKLYTFNSKQRLEFLNDFLKISHIFHLEELIIVSNALTNQGLYDFILRNFFLETVYISDCYKVTDEFVEKIIPHLKMELSHLSIRAGRTGISEENKTILLNKKN